MKLKGAAGVCERGGSLGPNMVTFCPWVCRASCSSAVDRAGPLSSGMAGGAPRRPGGRPGKWAGVPGWKQTLPTDPTIAQPWA